MEFIDFSRALFIAIILYAYNKSISKEIAKLLSAPFRWIYKEQPASKKAERFFFITARYSLYLGVFIAFMFAIKEIVALIAW